MARKAKPKQSLQEQEDEVILKYLNGEPMTLEETALGLWMYDGRKTLKPMSRMGILKLEQRILQKFRKACEEHGISEDDLFTFVHNDRMPASYKFGGSIDE